MQISIQSLLDYPTAIPLVVEWIERAWPKESTRDRTTVETRLIGNRRRDRLPLAILALVETLPAEAFPIGYVSLIQLDVADAPGQQFWIDGLYVEPAFRGQRIASRLLAAAIQSAANLGLDHLSVYTTQVSLYQRHGWTLDRQVSNGLTNASSATPVVMQRRIRSKEQFEPGFMEELHVQTAHRR
jgi:GNAT superfamily N-acetyltransferase